MSVSAIIVAAGRGERMGSYIYPSKVLIPLGGRTVLDRVLQAFHTSSLTDEILIVAPLRHLDLFKDEVRGSRFGRKVTAVVPGGDSRGESVRNGLLALTSSPDVVAVHDGARPFVTPDLIDRVIRRAFEHGAVMAAVRAVDAVKLTMEDLRGLAGLPEDESPRSDGIVAVERTLDRNRIWLAQTPQAFRTEILNSAYRIEERRSEEVPSEEAPWIRAPDDASLVEGLGIPVVIEAGDPTNVKITYPEDLKIARLLLERGNACVTPGGDIDLKRPADMQGTQSLLRMGFGHDVHRLVKGRKLILGGVEISYHKGLLGHSDADVLCHAIADALLGAAGLGDIGLHFPDTDERYKGARSLDLLARVVSMLRNGGWRVVNVDSVVVAEKPRISPSIQKMRESLSRCIGIGVSDVSIKATTKEGLGPVGRGECIEAFAVAGISRGE